MLNLSLSRKENELENKVNELTNISPLFAPGQHKTLYDYITGEIADTTQQYLILASIPLPCVMLLRHAALAMVFTEYTSNLINLCPKCRLPI